MIVQCFFSYVSVTFMSVLVVSCECFFSVISRPSSYCVYKMVLIFFIVLHGCYGADCLGFSDVKFLQLHEGASEETVFCWKVNTK